MSGLLVLRIASRVAQRSGRTLLVAAIAALFLVITMRQIDHRALGFAQLWMLPLPTGQEIDVQHTNDGAWAVYWQKAS